MSHILDCTDLCALCNLVSTSTCGSIRNFCPGELGSPILCNGILYLVSLKLGAPCFVSVTSANACVTGQTVGDPP